MVERTFTLPLSANYVADWGAAEAIRELVQNALDSPCPFETVVHNKAGRIEITSEGARLEASHLVMGASSKKQGDRGAFGEGFKLALLVLARAGLECTVWNGPVKWTAHMRWVEEWGNHVLQIDQVRSPEPRRGLTFDVSGLAEEELQKAIDYCLPLQQRDTSEDVITDFGTVLSNRAGKLYVGGLYVADTELEWGYDIKPEFLPLERDRNTVASFELTSVTQKVWLAAGQPNRVAEMMMRGSPDVSAWGGWTPEVAAACWKLFSSRHPKAVAAAQQGQVDGHRARGINNIIVVPSNFWAVLSGWPDYNELVTSLQHSVVTPFDKLQKWYDERGGALFDEAQETFLELLDEAQGWHS